MTLRNLEIFTAVYRCRSMSKAAQELMISQSSVSQAVAALEKEYGVRLFERLRQTLDATAAGERLFSLAVSILEQVRQIGVQMSECAAMQPLRVGFCTTAGSRWLYKITEWYEAEAGQPILAEVGNSSQLEDQVMAARLDAAIVQKTSVRPCLRYIPIWQDRLTAICSPDHSLAGKTVPISRLAKEPLVMREAGSGTNRLVQDMFLAHGVPMDTAWIVTGIPAVLEAVQKKRGIAFVSEEIARPALQKGTVAEITMADAVFSRSFALIYPQDTYRNTELALFQKLTERVCADLEQERKE